MLLSSLLEPQNIPLRKLVFSRGSSGWVMTIDHYVRKILEKNMSIVNAFTNIFQLQLLSINQIPEAR